MQADTRYDTLYKSAIQQGWPGWGGYARLAQGSAQIARILACSVVPRTGNALELGCGEGNFCRLLAQQGYTVTGVDISSVAIRWANEKNTRHRTTIRYIRGDLSRADFHLSGQFDLIVDGNCFHCILREGRSVFLQQVSASLSEHGIFFVSSLCSQDANIHIMLRDDEPYRHIPTSDSLQKEVWRAGFDILEQQIHTHPERKYDHMNLFLKRARSKPVIEQNESTILNTYTYDCTLNSPFNKIISKNINLYFTIY